MLIKASQNDVITGLGKRLVPHGVILLQYADDTIICLENDLEKARNLKLLLYIYELMAGLKINFWKSEIFVINGNTEVKLQYADLFDCQIGAFPMIYLGVPVSSSCLYISDWIKLEEKLAKRLEGWKGSSLSIAGRITLINSCLSNSPNLSHVACLCICYPRPLSESLMLKGEASCGKVVVTGENTIW